MDSSGSNKMQCRGFVKRTMNQHHDLNEVIPLYVDSIYSLYYIYIYISVNTTMQRT